jgi:hypothetical protein
VNPSSQLENPCASPVGAGSASHGEHVLHAPNAASSDSGGGEWFGSLWAVTAAFGTYFCMYAFRKPFTAATYEDVFVAGIAFKTVLVTSQTLGYMLSKFIGIKVISEMPPERRAIGILSLISIAEIALVLFGLVPRPWNAACLFLNGLTLGMVFGLVLGFLEGRRATEALAAGLCVSFILADDVVKGVGAWLLKVQVSEAWMPALTGLLFAGPLLLFVFMLSRVRPPNSRDVAARSERVTMTRTERWSLYQRYALGLTLIVVMYLLISILRSIRSDFAPELWLSLRGIKVEPETYGIAGLCVALGVMAINGALCLMRDSRYAFFASLGVCAAGLGLLIASLVGWQLGWLSGFAFMVLIGLGLYLPYVAVHTTVFERFLAMTREKGNLGFLMYVADSIGYLGVVAVLFAKNLVKVEGSFSSFFLFICWVTAGLSVVCLVGSWWYFAARAPRETESLPEPSE